MKQESAKYARQTHLNRVIASSAAKNTARKVLFFLCMESRFDRPFVTKTTRDICEGVRAGVKDASYERPDQADGCRWEPPGRSKVKEALRFLRAEGTLQYVSGQEGGRGHAVTWRLCVAKNAPVRKMPAGGSEAPSDDTIFDQVSLRFRAAEPQSWQAWIRELRFVSADGGELHLSAKSAFAASYVRTHFADALCAIAAEVDPSIRRVELTDQEAPR